MSQRSPVELVSHVAKCLGNLCDQVTFLGGAVVPLMLTEAGTRPPRITDDVDVAVELSSLLGFYELEEMLRARGFQNAMEGPVCRFKHGLAVLDVMPTDPNILGFTNRWYSEAIRSAAIHPLESAININLITPACFLATKLEAFDSPTRENHGDMYVSRDFEDFIAVIDGRAEIVADVRIAAPSVREYLRERLLKQMSEANWVEGVEAHVDDGRAAIVIQRIRDFVLA